MSEGGMVAACRQQYIPDICRTRYVRCARVVLLSVKQSRTFFSVFFSIINFYFPA